MQIRVRRQLIRVLLLLGVLCLPSCFTGFRYVPFEHTTSWDTKEQYPRVFGGTWAHVLSMKSGSTPWGGDYWGGHHQYDLPLCLVADILLLPYTIPAQLVWGDFEKPSEDDKEKR